MKTRTVTSIAIVAVLAPVLLLGAGPNDPPGVKGRLFFLEKYEGNAAQVDNLTIEVGDKILINWAYRPTFIPGTVSAKSSSASVKLDEIRRVVVPKVENSGLLGAFFLAEKEGKATLSFRIQSKDPGAGEGATVKCEVTVVKSKGP